VNIIWKVLLSRWTVLLQLEWNMFLWTLYGRYMKVGEQWYCSLNGLCYFERNMEGIAHRGTLVLHLECSVLQWTVCGIYCTAGGQWNCSLNVVGYSEHYMEFTAQEVDSGITAWMVCVTVKILWKLLHRKWALILQLEWSVFQWTLNWRYCTSREQWYCSLNVVCYS